MNTYPEDEEQKNPNHQSKVLFDLKECEHLYQKDKSSKLKKEIKQIQDQVIKMKERENKYYASLLLSSDAKKKIFNIDYDDTQEKHQQKIIGQDPIDGNLIMTEDEFRAKYKQEPN